MKKNTNIQSEKVETLTAFIIAKKTYKPLKYSFIFFCLSAAFLTIIDYFNPTLFEENLRVFGLLAIATSMSFFMMFIFIFVADEKEKKEYFAYLETHNEPTIKAAVFALNKVRETKERDIEALLEFLRVNESKNESIELKLNDSAA